jgi:hypothetical protein
MQWKAILATANPLVTPVLTGVTVNSKVIYQQPAWAKNVGVTEFNNEEIRYTSIPYAYEDFNNTRLKELRRKYRLDDVVRGAKSELEKMAKLRNWVNQQWKWCPPAEPYPAWDSHVLLERKNGFCVHFAIVMMQCAISLGHQARFVFGMHPLVSGGHEVCEVWSNEYKKWMFIDGADNIHHTDPTTKAPLSMLEVHDRLLKVCYGEQVAGPATRPRPQDVRNADDITTCYGLNLAPHLPPEDHKQFERRRPWAYWFLFRMVPRNNFFSQEYPVPKTQGISWDWTGYWLWEDRQTPRGWQYCYHNYTSRRSDLLWTINQVRFSAEYGTRPGLLDIRLGTVTPGLDSFQVNIDNKGWSKTKARFFWALHQGKNRIEMRVRNQAGICGPVSFVEVNYKKTAVANKKTIKARPQRRKSKITKRKRG